jgi:hypothetical protein
MIVSDVLDRGIPWTQLIVRSKRVHNDLNIRSAYRISVALAYALLLTLAAGLIHPSWLAPAIPILAALYLLNRRFYSFFARTRGPWFAARVVPLHYLYHLYNGVSFAVGSAIYVAARVRGGRIPGALPFTPWTGPGTESWDLAAWEPGEAAASVNPGSHAG